MNVLIVEDEQPAARRLCELLHRFAPQAVVQAQLGSVSDTIGWLQSHPEPDLIFMDIQLSDGESFEVFSVVEPACPVIFTTAYDRYVLTAFHQNGIEYLLKPIKDTDVASALQKYERLKGHFSAPLAPLMDQRGRRPRSRVLVRKSGAFMGIDVGAIAYIFSEHKLSFLVTEGGERFLAEQTLKDLESELDPLQFFRVNRKFIVRGDAIVRFGPYDRGRLWIELRPAVDEQVLISQERASAFKRWIDQ